MTQLPHTTESTRDAITSECSNSMLYDTNSMLYDMAREAFRRLFGHSPEVVCGLHAQMLAHLSSDELDDCAIGCAMVLRSAEIELGESFYFVLATIDATRLAADFGAELNRYIALIRNETFIVGRVISDELLIDTLLRECIDSTTWSGQQAKYNLPRLPATDGELGSIDVEALMKLGEASAREAAMSRLGAAALRTALSKHMTQAQ